MGRSLVVLLVLAATLVAGCLGPQGDEGGPRPADLANVTLVPVADGLTRPLGVVPDGPDRMLVVEQVGTVRAVEDGTLRPGPVVDLSDRVRSGGERGLLGLALSPHRDDRAYVSYTDTDGDSVLARIGVQGDRFDGSSLEALLSVDQPFANHNGGHVVFGPEGMLYLGLGDGGSAGDPEENGQDPTTLLGSLLRIDVDVETGYAVPDGNPFVGREGRDEIWATGLRNPWRFSFDDGRIFIGDVGQDRWEEVDVQPADRAGVNYGWDVWEADERFEAGEAPDAVFPVASYRNDAEECSITGGHVYRGDDVPPLQGRYVFGDFCSGRVWVLSPDDGGWRMEKLMTTDHRISSFGLDPDGELLLVDHRGSLHRFALDA